MSITFNADEIFEIAEDMERNGAKFYREAAGNASEEETKQMLLNMATMEDGHLKTFQEMRKQLTDQERQLSTFDPENEAGMYLQAMADAHGSEGKVTPSQKLTGKESIVEVIEIALNAEKESVVYYFGLKSMVPAKAGQDKVEAVILEELNHITTLLNYLKKYE